MMSHALAHKLLALPDQLVFIHPSDPDKAHRVSRVVATVNGILLTTAATDQKGGEL